MTQRERVMAIAVGALAVLVGGGFVVYTGYGIYEAKQNALDAKQRELSDADMELMAAKQKDRLLKNVAPRSLPGAHNEATNEYSRWLHESLLKHNIELEAASPSDNYLEKGKEFGKLRFTVRARARLDDLTLWLHDFDTLNCLHRIKSIKLSPVPDTQHLSVNMEIETFTLLKVTKAQSKFDAQKMLGKTPEESESKIAADAKRFEEKIVQRNIFGPPNKAPTIAPIGSIPGVVGKSVEVIVKAKDTKDGSNETDPEPFLAYRIVGGDLLPGAELDVAKGILRWTPKKKGEYKAIVEVVDNGIPRRATQQPFTIRVGDPPEPVKPVDKPKPPAFDTAKFAFVTAIIQEGDVGQVWINERSTGKSQKLKIGDDVKFGSVTGKVSRIDPTGVEVESGGSKFFAKVGQNLAAAASQAGGS